MNTTREDALATIKSLIVQFQLTPRDIASLYPTDEKDSGGFLQRMMIYIGGALIFMGLCVYITMIWDNLGSPERVIISFGSGLVAFILGMVALDDERFHKASTPLFIIAAALVPSGLFVFMNEYLPHTGDTIKAACVVFALTFLQNAVAFALTRRTTLLFFSLLFLYALFDSLLIWLNLDDPKDLLAISLPAFLVCRGLDKSPHAVIAPFYYLWAGLVTAAASFDVFAHRPFDVALIGVAAGMIYLCTLTGSRTLLTVGVISLLAYLGYFTDEYFKNIVGWPIALIIMGFVMIGVSVFAVKLGRKIATTGV